MTPRINSGGKFYRIQVFYFFKDESGGLYPGCFRSSTNNLSLLGQSRTGLKNRDLRWKSGFFWGEILQQPRPTVRIFLIVETQAVDCNGGLIFSFFLPAHEASGSRRVFNICYTVLKIYCKVRSGKIICFIKYSHFASNL